MIDNTWKFAWNKVKNNKAFVDIWYKIVNQIKRVSLNTILWKHQEKQREKYNYFYKGQYITALSITILSFKYCSQL